MTRRRNVCQSRECCPGPQVLLPSPVEQTGAAWAVCSRPEHFPRCSFGMTLQLDWSWFSLQTARLMPKPAPRGHRVVPARIPPALSRRSTQQHGPRSAEAAAPSAPQRRWISSANIARCRELVFRWTVCSSSTQRKCGLCCYTARANSVELLKQKKSNTSFTAMWRFKKKRETKKPSTRAERARVISYHQEDAGTACSRLPTAPAEPWGIGPLLGTP